MASGYLHISKEDIFAGEDGVIYWKNGAKILGEIVSCIDSNEDVHYYLKSTNIKKAILIDAFVPVGVNDYFLYSDSANFINVQIDSEDYSSIGGGDGIAITFLLPEGKYYTIHEIDEGGNLRIFDPAGDGGQIGGGGNGETFDFDIITQTKTVSSNVSNFTVLKSLTLSDFLDKIMTNKEVKGRLRHYFYGVISGEPDDPKTLYYNCCQLVHAEYVENANTYQIAFLFNSSSTSLSRKTFTFASDGTLSSIS